MYKMKHQLLIEQGFVILGLVVLTLIPNWVLLGGIVALIGDVVYQRYINHKERNIRFIESDILDKRLLDIETKSNRFQESVNKCNEGIAGVNAALGMLRR